MSLGDIMIDGYTKAANPDQEIVDGSKSVEAKPVYQMPPIQQQQQRNGPLDELRRQQMQMQQLQM